MNDLSRIENEENLDVNFFQQEQSDSEGSDMHSILGLSIESSDSESEELAEPVNLVIGENSCLICHEDPDDFSHLGQHKGLYKNKYPFVFKVMVIAAFKIGKRSVPQIQVLTGVCRKNIERWIEKGPGRQPGAGRRIANSLLEKRLVEWGCKEIERTGELRRMRFREEGYHSSSQKIPNPGF